MYQAFATGFRSISNATIRLYRQEFYVRFKGPEESMFLLIMDLDCAILTSS